MSSPRLPRDRRRTASIVLSSIALVAMSIMLFSVLGILATTTGASGMAAVLPLYGFLFTSWIWGILGLIALGLGLGSSRPVLPCVLAVAALLELTVGIIVLVQL